MKAKSHGIIRDRGMESSGIEAFPSGQRSWSGPRIISPPNLVNSGAEGNREVRRSLMVGRDQVRAFEGEIRRAVETFRQLPGQDSNLEKQDQNLL
jgi:hypothetical protein